MGTTQTEGVVDRSAEQIRRRIIKGVYAPGQRLVETELIEELGVSRTALREAFRRLEAENLIEAPLYRGVAVRRFTKRDVTDTFDVRIELEGMAARRAAEVCELADNRRRVLAIRDQLEEALDQDDNIMAYAAANDEFHDLIIDLAGNRILAAHLKQLQPPTLRFLYSHLMGAGEKHVSMVEHRTIIDALLASNGAAAEKTTRLHILHSRDNVLRLPSEYFSPEGR